MKLEDLKKGRWEVLPAPVLQPSASGWDSHSSMTPVVFRNSDMGIEAPSRYGMLYIGSGPRSTAWGLGFATSDDLFNWQRSSKNPVLLQNREDSFQLDAPCLVRSATGLRLICEEKKVDSGLGTMMRGLLSPGTKQTLRALRKFVGLEKPTVVNHASGRYFVSFDSDGILNWNEATKKVVFEAGEEGSFDSCGVFSPQVYRFGGRYYLFYGGTDGLKASTGLAVSDGALSNWTRACQRPVLSPGKSSDWDGVNSLIVSVMRLSDCYCAFYEGEDSDRRYSIGMAWSYDLLNWTKWPENPVISPGRAPYCAHMVCGPRVFSEGKDLYMFFNGHGRDMRGHCGMAIFRRSV